MFSFTWNTITSTCSEKFGPDKEFYLSSYCINAKPPIYIYFNCEKPVLTPRRIKLKISEKTADGFTSSRKQKLCMLTVQSMIVLEVKHKILFCEIEEITFPSNNLVGRQQPKRITEDLKNFWDSNESKDVTFIIDSRQLRAHKLILQMRSPVFKNMFDSDMVEKQSGVIEIKDISYECFLSLLQFIYTDNCDCIRETPEALLYAAEKYEIVGLKFKAAMALLEKIKPENAIDIAILLDRYQLPEFWQEAMTYVNSNKGAVLQTVDLKTPDVVKEFYAMMSLNL